MKNAGGDGDKLWERGWEEHKRSQLKRLAKLPLAEKLEWLEGAETLGRRLVAQSKRSKRNKTSPDGP